ncbi:hypothetical protein AHF37_05706 [Paragonimus kellicotti]|nr:hypothetical protein AHF37_05706 [Paragonimus kellicotti]
MKYTRALSFGNLADYEVMNALHFKISPDKPIHRPTQSLLTTTSGFNNFRGLLNWGAFLLLITTSRMALENVINLSTSIRKRYSLNTSEPTILNLRTYVHSIQTIRILP